MFLVKRIVGLRVLYIYSFTFGLVELGKCTRIRGLPKKVSHPCGLIVTDRLTDVSVDESQGESCPGLRPAVDRLGSPILVG